MPASSMTLRKTLLAGFCASALMMGACSGGDKVPAEEITVDAASLGLTSADESKLSQHFVITARAGTEAETLSLLDGASFDDATYGDRTITGSTVVYTDWTATTGKETMRADRVEMIGLNETDDGTTLDKLVVNGMSIQGYDGFGDDKTEILDATIGGLVVVKPSPAMFVNLSDVLMARDGSGEATSSALEAGEAFRAVQLEDMVANVNEDGKVGNLTLKQVIVGNDMDTGMMDIVLETLNFDWASADSTKEGLNLEMDGLTVMGFNTVQMTETGLTGLGATQGIMANVMSSLTPSALMPYRQLDLGKVAMTSAMLDLTTDGYEALSTEKGDVTELRAVMSPLLITLKDLSGTVVEPYIDVLRENGFAEISLKGASTTIFDRKADRVSFTDNSFEIDEGLRTQCEYSVLGLMAAEAALKATGSTPPNFSMPDGGYTDEAFQAYMAEVEAYNVAKAKADELIKIEAFDCDVQDVAGNSLVERGYDVAAAVTGKPVGVLKGGAKTMIALGSLTAQSEFQRDLMDTVGTGLIDFIDTPGQTMTITMTPDAPVSIMSLTGQDGTEPSIAPLNLSVEVR